MWHATRKRWMYAPGIAAGLLFDDSYSNESTTVDRTTAEAMARQYLHSELPSEQTLREMCEEGDRMGWDLGPPEE
jgi:hypothetical protein